MPSTLVHTTVSPALMVRSFGEWIICPGGSLPISTVTLAPPSSAVASSTTGTGSSMGGDSSSLRRESLLLAKLVATDGLGEHPAVLLLGHVLRARQALCVHRLAARLGGHCGVVIPAAGAVTGDHALDGVVGVGDESLGRVHQVLGPGLDP